MRRAEQCNHLARCGVEQLRDVPICVIAPRREMQVESLEFSPAKIRQMLILGEGAVQEVLLRGGEGA